MGRKNNLTDEDLHRLLEAKIKEPGISLAQLYTDISRIHNKPNVLFGLCVCLSLISFMFLMCSKSIIICKICLVVYIATAYSVLGMQKKHSFIDISFTVLLSIFVLAFMLCLSNLHDVGIKDAILQYATKIWTEIQ